MARREGARDRWWVCSRDTVCMRAKASVLAIYYVDARAYVLAMSLGMRARAYVLAYAPAGIEWVSC